MRCAANRACSCATLHARVWRDAGSLEAPRQTELGGPTCHSTERLAVWSVARLALRYDEAHRAYAATIEQPEGAGLWHTRLGRDGEPLGRPTDLGPGRDLAMTLTAEGALVVHRTAEAAGLVAQPIIDGVAGDAMPLPSEVDAQGPPALVVADAADTAAGDERFWLAWISPPSSGEQRVESLALTARGAVASARQTWVRGKGAIDELHLVHDDFGPLLACASRPFKSSPMSIWLQRPPSSASERTEPLPLAEQITTPGLAIASPRAGLFLTAYLRHGRNFGDVTSYTSAPSRIVGRFAQLPGATARPK